MLKITPHLWFDNNAEEAMNFYVSLFPNSHVNYVSRLPVEAPGQSGPVVTGSMTLNGQDIMVLNGGPMFKFNESFSLFVDCDTQEQVDELWNKLTANGGEESQCGWLKDRFGLSWQIVPKALGQLMGDPDPAKAQRVMQAMLKMRKLIVKDLQAAYDGR